MDRFAWAFQDFLPVVAARNFGYREQDSTLTSPAVAKNCVAVGDTSSCSNSRSTYLVLMLVQQAENCGISVIRPFSSTARSLAAVVNLLTCTY